MNKFVSVVGFFFFLLMKNFDVKVNILDFLGDDIFVFGRFVYIFGIIMYFVREIFIVRNMGVVLLEFIWVLKYYEEVFVR